MRWGSILYFFWVLAITSCVTRKATRSTPPPLSLYMCVCVCACAGGGGGSTSSPQDDTPPADLSDYYLLFKINSYFFFPFLFACSALTCNPIICYPQREICLVAWDAKEKKKRGGETWEIKHTWTHIWFVRGLLASRLLWEFPIQFFFCGSKSQRDVNEWWSTVLMLWLWWVCELQKCIDITKESSKSVWGFYMKCSVSCVYHSPSSVLYMSNRKLWMMRYAVTCSSLYTISEALPICWL